MKKFEMDSGKIHYAKLNDKKGVALISICGANGSFDLPYYHDATNKKVTCKRCESIHNKN